MNLTVQSDTQWIRDVARMRTRLLATELSAAARDADEHRVKTLLTELLHCRAGRPEETFRVQLQALESLFHTMRRLAMTDDLTRLNNRRGFFRVGARLLKVAERERCKVRVVHVDVDNLKFVNDNVGHLAGDLLLQRTANVLRRSFPDHEIDEVIGRLGGDEFAVLALSRHPFGPHEVALRVQKAVDAQNASGWSPALSLSVGVAELGPDGPFSMTDVLERAERAMYTNKRTKWDRRAVRRVEATGSTAVG